MFIFNNVKSDLKIMFCQLNHSSFQGKSITFVTSIPIPKAPMGRGWADIYIVKGVSDALVLTIRELRKLICQSRTKQQGTSHGCIVYSPYWLRLHFAFVAKKGYLYTYTYVGLSALYQRLHSKMIFLICYLLDYQQVHDNANVSIVLLGDKKEPTK